MKRTTFYIYSDPGHSWVKVPKLLLEGVTTCDY